MKAYRDAGFTGVVMNQGNVRKGVWAWKTDNAITNASYLYSNPQAVTNQLMYAEYGE